MSTVVTGRPEVGTVRFVTVAVAGQEKALPDPLFGP